MGGGDRDRSTGDPEASGSPKRAFDPNECEQVGSSVAGPSEKEKPLALYVIRSRLEDSPVSGNARCSSTGKEKSALTVE